MVIQSRITPPDWTDDMGGGEEGARCRLFPISRADDGLVRNDAWFQEADEALSVCNGEFSDSPCPLRDSCLRIALVNNDLHGVWGGMTSPQRKWVRRNIPSIRWRDSEHLREVVPPPDYFSSMGDEDPDEDEEDFQRERIELAESAQA